MSKKELEKEYKNIIGKQIEEVNEDLTILFKIVDKLEKRIATLEKVLESHAKCIGEMRENKDEWVKILPRT